MKRKYLEIRNTALKDVRCLILNNISQFRKAYRYVIELAMVARDEGLLALESNIGFLDDSDPITKNYVWMIRMIIDGIDPEYLEEAVTNRFISREYTGLDAFMYYLYSMGSSYIQEGRSPKEIEEFFNSFVPEELIPENTINHKLFDLAEQRLMKQSQKKLKEISGLMTDTELNAVSKVKDSIYNLNENEWALITAEKGFTYWDILIPLCDPATRIIIDSHMSEGRILQYLWYPRMPKDGEIQKCCDSYFQVIREIREEQKRKMNADEVILEILAMDKKDIGTAIKEEYYSNTHNTIALALKGVTEQVVERLLDSVDKRTAMYIRDEMELMGPVKITEVEQAQKVLKMDVMGLEVARSLKKQK